ncbi:MAG: RidA family protein [Chloroflexota bacterium]
MRQITLVNPDSLPPPTGFAHASICDGTAWIAGQIGCDPKGVIHHAADIVAQFRVAMQNLGTVLSAAGCAPQGVVKFTYYVTDIRAYRENLDAIGEAYRDVMGRHYPASTLVEVRALFDPDAMIEIECIAMQGNVLAEHADTARNGQRP